MNEVVVYFPMAFIKFPGRKVGYAKTRKWFKSVCHIWEMMFTVLLCGLLCIFPTLFPILLSQGRCAKAGLHTNHLDITKAASSQAPAGSRQLWGYESYSEGNCETESGCKIEIIPRLGYSSG